MVPLQAYAGKKVLLTISAAYVKPEDAIPDHHYHPVRFGNLRIDNNPDSLDLNSSPPLPANVMIKTPETPAQLAEWKKHISPAKRQKS